MQIKNIFSKDLFRPINGVVKADQKDETIVWQELEEYVITRELDGHFRRFFETYLNAVQNSHDPNIVGRTGVWISGFFGSGKSHFLKILSYILQNFEIRNPNSGESRNAVSFFDNKVHDPMLLADLKKAASTSTDVVLFNIDSRADAREGREAILSVFWRVFNEMQGFSGDAPHIADMERYLTEKGKYEEFCSAFQELSGDSWLNERDAYYFHRDEVIRALSKTLGQSVESAEKWFEEAETSVTLNVETFARRVKEYLDKKGNDHRIVFFVDEVGQFIGDDGHLMLSLQTITEDLGRVCQGRAWVVVTSQEDIDSLVGDLKSTKANDFSKIQGRFTTRLSLSSSNTDEVIQARLLAKKPEASRELQSLFASKGDILISQLSFSSDSASLKSYSGEDDFVANYPFAPYHFQLVQKVFESIRKAGATGLHLSRGERSMLDAFQSAAKHLADRETGALVPLYLFYPAIESFLDTAVKRTIDQADENPGLEKPFDIHLLQTLFLIRYVDIIKPNVDNLVTLFISEADSDRLAIKRDIEAGLQRLEKQTLISRNGDLYFFLTNVERDVSREIKGVEVSSSEETKLMAEIVYTEILKEQKQYRYTPYKKDYPFGRLLDGQPFGTRVDQEISVEVITPLFGNYDAFNEAKLIMYTVEHYGRILVKLQPESDLEREVRAYLQTDKYIRQKSDVTQSNTFENILRTRQEQNRERKGRLKKLLAQMIMDADFSAMGQTLQIKSSTPKAAVEEAIEYVIQNLYNKFSYLKNLHENPANEIKAVLLSSDVGQMQFETGGSDPNQEAMREVKEYIFLMLESNKPVVLKDLAEHFAGVPYGWPEWETVLLVAKIFMGGELNLFVDGAGISARDAVDPMRKTAKWKNVKILKRKTPSSEDMQKARKNCQEIFGKLAADKADNLERMIKSELARWRNTFNQFRQLAETGDYPGAEEIRNGLSVVTELLGIKDGFEFITTFNRKKDDLLDVSDDLHTLEDFYNNQRPTWEHLKNSLAEFSKNEAALDKYQEASSALKELRTIAEAPAPYGRLKDVNPLVSEVSDINERIVDERKKDALAKLDAKIGAVKKHLDVLKTDADFSNQVLSPLQRIRRRVEAETSIPNISYQLEEAVQAEEEALERIEQKKQEKEGGDAGSARHKKTKKVNPAKVYGKYYLESEQDVRDYVKALEQRLLSELKKDVLIMLMG